MYMVAKIGHLSLVPSLFNKDDGVSATLPIIVLENKPSLVYL
jgi:hypothetical protein